MFASPLLTASTLMPVAVYERVFGFHVASAKALSLISLGMTFASCASGLGGSGPRFAA